MVISEDDGFSWTLPKFTNILGYPLDLITLKDGRYLMVYGYRRKPYVTRGIISEDGINWDIKNEFIIREGGVPGKVIEELFQQQTEVPKNYGDLGKGIFAQRT